MAKNKRPGLHKEISSIFGGVPLPKDREKRFAAHTGTPAFITDQGRASPAAEPVQPSVVPSPPVASQPRQQSRPQQPHKVVAAPKKKPSVPQQPRVELWTRIVNNVAWRRISNKLFAPKASVSNARQKIMTLLVSVLFVVFILVIMVFKPFSSKKAANTVGMNMQTATGSSSVEVNWKPAPLYPADLREPMQFGSGPGGWSSTGQLVVKGIVYSSDSPTAVIDTRIVHEGVEVFGAKVVKINKESVEFEKDGKRWTQTIQP